MQVNSSLMFVPLAAVMASGVLAQAQKSTRAAPTTADWAAIAKLPDLTGVWETPLGPPAGGDRGRGGTDGTAGRGRAGRAGRGAQAAPPLTAEYAAKARAQPTTQGGEQQTANCLPPGLPGIMSQPYPYEFLMTPGQVTIISEAYNQVRHVYTDGRTLAADPDPNFYGTSVGRWEENTLVVETTGLAQVSRGLPFPHSDKLKIVERFRLTDPDTMTVETTIIDPEALTMPWPMGTRTLKRHRNWTLAEYICEENNRNFVDANGNAGTRLTNPLASPK